uniref:ATP synthase F0 subunit 8 n=1 Tax=Tridacna crocea TaxID=80833 RepID=A0A6B9P3M4_TRICC|nr:ATP synthase F0 subunit 8 [Tridacna crocea]QHD44989.1 ATP synthase F0 subunit 8 [Tridacna crocea]QRV60352.1 ATP synthase F0 subunit 8 [Tridacna crocea]UJM44104.1 ATP synthase F0 subunit 8 [Tridacna crocea]
MVQLSTSLWLATYISVVLTMFLVMAIIWWSGKRRYKFL